MIRLTHKDNKDNYYVPSKGWRTEGQITELVTRFALEILLGFFFFFYQF